MSERKHTPGPWEVVDPGPKQLLRIHFYDVDADDDGRARDYGHDICEMADVADDWENAHLIAAAPDLFELVREWRAEMAGFFPDSPRAKQAARIDAALAKARGVHGSTEERSK